MADKDFHHGDEIDTSRVENATVHHERSDVRVKPIALFLVWLTVAAVVIHLLMAGLYKVFVEREKEAGRSDYPLGSERQTIPHEPRLQLAPEEKGQKAPNFVEQHPLNDMKKLRAEEDDKLRNYEWADDSKQSVRIPIEDAKRIVLGRLPFKMTTYQQQQRKAQGASQPSPSDASSGRAPQQHQ